jgi:hypothetical protein
LFFAIRDGLSMITNFLLVCSVFYGGLCTESWKILPQFCTLVDALFISARKKSSNQPVIEGVRRQRRSWGEEEQQNDDCS